ncbi:MAG: sporulation protein YqfD [Bacilli bacterium]|nr:sporulation protein YqfD [Bacilli bacterium]
MISKITLKITGRNSDYFTNILISKNINFSVINKTRKELIITVSDRDYKKIKSIKTSYKIKVIRVYGLLYIKYLFKNYLSFIISFFICLMLVIITSNLIFEIDINSNNTNLEKTILEDLKVRGISKYRFKVNYDKKRKIVNEILNEERDTIEWLEIEEYGTKYIINVVERIKNTDKEECIPSNIVAKKDAIITSVEAYSGEVLTYINKSVKKGDILISGRIYNKEEVVNTKCSRGRVFGEVWYQVFVDLPKHYYEENVTGNVERRIGIDFFNYSSKSSYKTYKRKDIDIYDNKLLPIRLFYTEYLETNVIDKYFTIDNVDEYALEKATTKMLNKIGKDDRIVLKKILKKEEKNSRIIVGVFFKVNEDITKVENIIDNGE